MANRESRGARSTAGGTAQREKGARSGASTGGNGAAQGGALEWIKSIAVAAVIFLVLRTFLVQTFVITSGSMEDTLLVGDFLVVNRAAIGSRVPLTDVRIPGYSEPRRGDVLVFDPAHEVNMMLVKRLIGMPGDTLSMRERVLFINGQAVDEPYVKHIPDTRDDVPPPGMPQDRDMSWQQAHVGPGVDRATYQPTRDNWGPLVVPEGHYFMLGDNREQSLDSRYWGLVEAWRVEGRAVFIYFSYDKESPRPFAFLREVRLGRIGDRIR
jgi:signal peptidase I